MARYFDAGDPAVAELAGRVTGAAAEPDSLNPPLNPPAETAAEAATGADRRADWPAAG